MLCDWVVYTTVHLTKQGKQTPQPPKELHNQNDHFTYIA